MTDKNPQKIYKKSTQIYKKSWILELIVVLYLLKNIRSTSSYRTDGIN